MLRRILIAAAGAFLFTAIDSSYAADPKFDQIVVGTSSDTTKSESIFPTNSPQIVIQAHISGAAAGTKVAAAWIAEKTSAAPPDYRIDANEFTMDGRLNVAVFSLSRPTAGWPVGLYRAELSINGKPANTVAFSVK